MAEIEIGPESTGHQQWRYEVYVYVGGRRHEYAVSLSWADYDLWCKGRVAPQAVVRAAFEFMLEREPASSILGKFDCALIRRYFPDVDRVLPGMV